MNKRIRLALTSFAASALAATAVSLGTATPAAAFGAETLGCIVTPGTIPLTSGHCQNSTPAATYDIGFSLMNAAGSYTYSWKFSGAYTAVVSGCTTTSAACWLRVTGGATDSFVTTTVTFTQNGQSLSRTARATTTAFCNGLPC